MIPDKLRDKGKFWTDAWTLVKGCTPVSEGCVNCWSAAMAHRFKQSVGGVELTTASGHWTEKVYSDYAALEIPGRAKKPRIYAVWNDLFHPDVFDRFIIHAWHVMAQNPSHTFIILTKRPERAVRWAGEHCVKPLANVWFMGTMENQKCLEERVSWILQFPAVVKGVIIEPMLGPVDLVNTLFDEADLEVTADWRTGHNRRQVRFRVRKGAKPRLNWLIVGVETGSGRRSCDIENVRHVVEQCKAVNVPVWVKGVEVEGKIIHKMDELPADLRVREWPR